MIFIDASFYLAVLNPHDSNHHKVLGFTEQYQDEDYITSQAVLGEVLTVGSQRFHRPATIEFVERILESETVVVLESQDLMDRTFKIFKQIRNKNISWVDCYSFAIMEKYEVETALTFDKDFQRIRVGGGG